MANNHIKIYIPLDLDHVEFGAKLIFDFLEQNNISHVSKLGKRIRFDNIVVRLLKIEDAEKLIDFVSNNSFIRDGLIEANPFAFQKNGIALTVDGQISYNTTISNLIDLYIYSMRKQNKLDFVNTNDFYKFVHEKFIGQFVNNNDNSLKSLFEWKSVEESNNYFEVISLIIKVADPNFKYDDFINHYRNCSSVNLENVLEDVNNLLLETVVTMTKAYSHPSGYLSVKDFFDTGETSRITRANRLRDRMIKNNFRDRLDKILKEKNTNFNQYLNVLLNENDIDIANLSTSKRK